MAKPVKFKVLEHIEWRATEDVTEGRVYGGLLYQEGEYVEAVDTIVNCGTGSIVFVDDVGDWVEAHNLEGRFEFIED